MGPGLVGCAWAALGLRGRTELAQSPGTKRMHFELELRLHRCHVKPSLCFLVGRALRVAWGRRKVHLPPRQWGTHTFLAFQAFLCQP